MGNTITGGTTTTPPPQQFNMTFSDMQDTVYFLIDESPSELFPRGVIKRYINQGLYEVARQAGIPHSKQTFYTPLVGGACALEHPILTRDTAVVSHVRFNGDLLEHMDEDDIADKSRIGTPRGYYADGGTVKLYPIPTTTADTIEVEYVREPTPLVSDTDISTMVASAQELACVWAAMKCKGKDDEFNSRDRLAAEFAEGIARLTGPLTGFYK